MTDKIIADYKTELDKKGTIAFVPSGTSMWPTLKSKKQAVVIEKKGVDRLSKNQVALFKRATGEDVLHRVIEVLDNGYNFLGDSCLTPEFVLEEDVYGVMIGFYKGEKFISSSDEKYVRKYTKWYSNEVRRKKILKRFYFRKAIKNKLKAMFKRKGA